MLNPWTNLPLKPPYLLSSDAEAIFHFNLKATPEYQVRSELLPEPFLGDTKANIFLLNLNPGYSECDSLFHHENPYFIKQSRANLSRARAEYPFFLLNPEILKSPGHEWWTRRLRELISLYGLKKIANEVCCIEYFPYHSKKFRQLGTILDSQKYGFELVREAINKNALIIIMRAENHWLEAVPELTSYNYYTLNSPRSAAISNRNMPDGFKKIIEILH